MSNEQQTMIAAVGEIEAAAQQLASAVDRYVTAYRAVAHAAASENRQHTLDGTVGTKLYELLVWRLRGLGLDSMLKRARTPGMLTDTWVAELDARIRAFVP